MTIIIVSSCNWPPAHPWIANPHDDQRKDIGAGDEQAVVPAKQHDDGGGDDCDGGGGGAGDEQVVPVTKMVVFVFKGFYL